MGSVSYKYLLAVNDNSIKARVLPPSSYYEIYTLIYRHNVKSIGRVLFLSFQSQEQYKYGYAIMPRRRLV